ncbi:MAG TPA: hypothetical protein VEI97_17230 [bacterium]|nr:hypothetical protein [bacterium]
MAVPDLALLASLSATYLVLLAGEALKSSRVPALVLARVRAPRPESR